MTEPVRPSSGTSLLDPTNPEELMTVAAWLYYHDGLTQEQVARELGISRVRVTRLLQRARREGIVQIRITRPLPLQYRLERALRRTFGLKDAIVVRTRHTREDTLNALGQAGADYLQRIVFPGCRLGLGWSTTVSRMAPYLTPPPALVPFTVHELAGSMVGQTNPYSISWRVAEVFRVPLEPLPVPILVESAAAREAVLRETQVRRALEHARQCDIAFVGVGSTREENTLTRLGLLTPDQMRLLRERGAVGDILMRYFDGEGRHVPLPWDDRIIALEWEDILRIPHRIIMAAGKHKVPALLGALRGGLGHTLITDTETARALLAAGGFSEEPPP